METLCQGDCHGPSSRRNPIFPTGYQQPNQQKLVSQIARPASSRAILLALLDRRKTSRKYSKEDRQSSQLLPSVYPYSWKFSALSS
eukprot:scaffold1551_cov164-Ochromonas_danica.AAC.18